MAAPSPSPDRSPTKLLLVDDDDFELKEHRAAFADAGFELLTASTVAAALRILEEHAAAIVLAILDMRIPPGPEFDPIETHGGYTSGLALGRWIRARHPQIRLTGWSYKLSPEGRAWFLQNGDDWLDKNDPRPDALVRRVEHLLNTPRALKSPRVFIVHGHNDSMKLQLKNFLQNSLGLGEPLILHELPQMGRTIFEKFEEAAHRADFAFVLLTPEDIPYAREVFRGEADDPKRRARQNVILELGYFLGLYGRRTGRVILLYQGPLELPSDIHGLSYIDMTNGFESAKDAIRAELSPWLKNR